MLQGTEFQKLLEEVAAAAADLLQAEGGMVTLVVEEGRFLKITAAVGLLTPVLGMLLPMEGSLSGWAVLNDTPLLSPDMDADPAASRPLLVWSIRSGARPSFRCALPAS